MEAKSMELKKILIITSSIDETASYIIRKYSDLADFFRVNVDKFSEYRFCIGNDDWSISDKYATINSENIYSIYYRNSWLFVSIAPYSQQFNARHEAIGGIRWTN